MLSLGRMWVRGSSSPIANWAFDVFKLTLRNIMVIRAKSSGQMDSLLSHNSFPVFVSVDCETRGR